MSQVSKKQAIGVWFFLVAATLVTGWLSEDHSFAGQWAIVIIVLVASAKACALMWYYMEIKWAPAVWRVIFNGWILIVSLVILVGYWLCLG